VELGGARWPGSGGGVGELGRLEVGDGTDSWGSIDRLTWERRAAQKARNKKGRRISCEDATDARAGWAGRDSFGLRGRCSQWVGRARGRVGRKVGRAEIKKKNF
jgi:hypothetical protein